MDTEFIQGVEWDRIITKKKIGPLRGSHGYEVLVTSLYLALVYDGSNQSSFSPSDLPIDSVLSMYSV